MARGKWLSSAERERILELQRDGLGVAAIAARLGRSYTFVYRHLRDAGDAERARSRGDRARRRTGNRRYGSETDVRARSDEALGPAWFEEGSLVVSASPLAPPRMETEFAKSAAQDGLGAAVEGGEDSCEPLPLTPRCAISSLPQLLGLSTPAYALPDTLGDRLVSRGGEAFDHATYARITTPTEPLAPYLTWIGAEDFEEGAVAPGEAALYALPPSVDHPTSPSSSLHASLQDEIRRLSCQRSIGLVDAQLLQLLTKFQADVLLLTRQSPWDACARGGSSSQPEAELDEGPSCR